MRKLRQAVCGFCKKKFWHRQKSVKYCSHKCHGQTRFTQIKRICNICKKTFYVQPHRIKTGRGKYCSRICQDKAFGKRKLRLGAKHSEITKIKISKNRKGKCLGNQNPFWKGGKYKTKIGYIYRLNPNHPFCNSMGYVMEHRLVMEMKLGRFLTKKEVVHHINGIINDNREKNLKLFSSCGKHSKFHLKH